MVFRIVRRAAGRPRRWNVSVWLVGPSIGPNSCREVRRNGSRSRLRSFRTPEFWWRSGRLTPHVLRHYCASSLYASGMDLKALQELLGHEWLSTTTHYIHVRSDFVETAWTDANRRVESRLGGR